MNDLQRSVESRVGLQNSAIKPGVSSAQAGRKVAICLLAALIVSVMIVWFSFLGWGLVAILQWLGDYIKAFWTTYF
jgi:hypothetical protein